MFTRFEFYKLLLPFFIMAWLTGCTWLSAKIPPQAMRKTPPKQLNQRALNVGTSAPLVKLTGVKGGKTVQWTSKNKASIAYIFYRGYW